jgi:hypothetical protein
MGDIIAAAPPAQRDMTARQTRIVKRRPIGVEKIRFIDFFLTGMLEIGRVRSNSAISDRPIREHPILAAGTILR